MKNKAEKQAEAKVRQEEYNKLSPKQKLMKLNLQVGDKGAKKQVARLLHEIASVGSIPEGVGDSIQKKEKKPYQKPKRS